MTQIDSLLITSYYLFLVLGLGNNMVLLNYYLFIITLLSHYYHVITEL